MNEFLLVVESILFLGGSVLLFRQERMYGIFFFALYIYAIFSQIGYLYVPELSIQIFAYFGEAIWQETTLFIICSALCLLLFLRYGGSVVRRIVSSYVARLRVRDKSNPVYENAVLLAIGLSLLLQAVLFAAQFADINWDNAQREDLFSTSPLLAAFVLLVKLSVGLNLAMYCHLRQRPLAQARPLLLFMFAFSISSFLVFTFKLGNRTDDVAIFLGLVIFEMNQIRFRLRHLLIGSVLVLCVAAYLNFMEANRYQEAPLESDFITKILVKDYFAPAHVLFASVSYHVVVPLEVAGSNCGNALMFLGQPYLQALVMDFFLPGRATRSASYGFYPFTEGYMVAGFAGFLYNGLVLGSLLTAWRALAMTNSRKFNNFLLAILGSMLINLVRGQTSYYIKYLYTFVFPGTVVYLAISNQTLWLHRKVRANP